MIVVNFEIPIILDKDRFLDEMKQEVRSLNITWLQSDNQHHKLKAETPYPIDLITLGMAITLKLIKW